MSCSYSCLGLDSRAAWTGACCRIAARLAASCCSPDSAHPWHAESPLSSGFSPFLGFRVFSLTRNPASQFRACLCTGRALRAVSPTRISSHWTFTGDSYHKLVPHSAPHYLEAEACLVDVQHPDLKLHSRSCIHFNISTAAIGKCVLARECGHVLNCKETKAHRREPDLEQMLINKFGIYRFSNLWRTLGDTLPNGNEKTLRS